MNLATIDFQAVYDAYDVWIGISIYDGSGTNVGPKNFVETLNTLGIQNAEDWDEVREVLAELFPKYYYARASNIFT
jgi:hypothetical protein